MHNLSIFPLGRRKENRTIGLTIEEPNIAARHRDRNFESKKAAKVVEHPKISKFVRNIVLGKISTEKVRRLVSGKLDFLAATA